MTDKVHPLAGIISGCARAISGVQVRWVGAPPDPAQQLIYFANHTSHLDFVVLWSALPAEARARTRPVAARDYWQKGLRAYLACQVFRAVLVQRGAAARAENEEKGRAAGHDVIEQLVSAMGTTESLILFPEGTRGTGESIVPFRSGLYHLAKRRPDVALVPAYLNNLNRILPKGEFLPVPLMSSLSFGEPTYLFQTENKNEFLERMRGALYALRPREGLT